MQIKIRENCFVSTCGYNPDSKEFIAFIEANRGKWVDVETEHLFENQYNTEKFRVMDRHICAVREDARIGKGKCVYCGGLVSVGETCTKHDQCSAYGIKWFNAETTMYIAHPNGVPAVKECKMDDQKKFGTFRLEQLGGSLNYYRLKNARETFNFQYADGVFYMLNGSPRKNLGIKAQSFSLKELKAYLDSQNVI